MRFYSVCSKFMKYIMLLVSKHDLTKNNILSVQLYQEPALCNIVGLIYCACFFWNIGKELKTSSWYCIQESTNQLISKIVSLKYLYFK